MIIQYNYNDKTDSDTALFIAWPFCTISFSDLKIIPDHSLDNSRRGCQTNDSLFFMFSHDDEYFRVRVCV